MPQFTVDLAATADVTTSVCVEATDAAAAEQIALALAEGGDLVWSYDGVDDGSIVVNDVSGDE